MLSWPRSLFHFPRIHWKHTQALQFPLHSSLCVPENQKYWFKKFLQGHQVYWLPGILLTRWSKGAFKERGWDCSFVNRENRGLKTVPSSNHYSSQRRLRSLPRHPPTCLLNHAPAGEHGFLPKASAADSVFFPPISFLTFTKNKELGSKEKKGPYST